MKDNPSIHADMVVLAIGVTPVSYTHLLQDTLKMEQDRYIKQFTALESVIAQMNSQSSWLSQFRCV